MTGLDSIAMAASLLESKDRPAIAESDSKQTEESGVSKSEGLPAAAALPNGATFANAQPRMVSGDAAAAASSSRPDTDSETAPKPDDDDVAKATATGTAGLLVGEGEPNDNTTKGDTCHDTTAVTAQGKTTAAPLECKTETKPQQPEHNFTNTPTATPSATATEMQVKKSYRPISLDLTAPAPGATGSGADINVMTAVLSKNDGGGSIENQQTTIPTTTSIALADSVGSSPATSNLSLLTASAVENARRLQLPNQISQKILLKHQSEDGAADDPIATLLSRISNITGDLPLLFSLMEELCEIGVREYGPPAEVVPNTMPIDRVGRCDVLSGRGGETNHHYGNVQYRRIVKACQPAYLMAKRRDKPRVAAAIVRVIRSRSGRFLKKDLKDNMWRDVGNNKAREKSSQALREGAPELRNLVQITDQSPSGTGQTPGSDGAAPAAAASMAPPMQQQQQLQQQQQQLPFVYVHDGSNGQAAVVRNVDGQLLTAMAMAGGPPSMMQYASYGGGPLPPQASVAGMAWTTAVAASGGPSSSSAVQMAGHPIYQKAIQQYKQLCGDTNTNKRPAPSEETAPSSSSSSDNNNNNGDKKPRVVAPSNEANNEESASPADVAV